MKATKVMLITASVIMSLLLLTSCGKEAVQPTEANQPPVILFLRPNEDLIIEQETLLVFKFQPLDVDGHIAKVELFLNGNLIQTLIDPPYQTYPYAVFSDKDEILTFLAIAYDNQGATGQAERHIEIRDFRPKYLGDFYFRSIKTGWSVAYGNTIDTSYYHGLIRKYELIDSQNDYFQGDDSNEPSSGKITFEYQPNEVFTSLVNPDGSIVPKSHNHYHHEGGFAGVDTIAFTFSNFALGGGTSYDVLGIRE